MGVTTVGWARRGAWWGRRAGGLAGEPTGKSDKQLAQGARREGGLLNRLSPGGVAGSCRGRFPRGVVGERVLGSRILARIFFPDLLDGKTQ